MSKIKHPWGDRVYRKQPVTWLPKAQELLRRLAPTMTYKQLALALGRSPDAVRMYCYKHKIKIMRQPVAGAWSAEDDAILVEMAGKLPPKEIAISLGRTESAIISRCKVKGLSTSVRQRRRMWTSDEVEWLTANHRNLTIRQMAEHLGRTYESVAQKCQYIGLDCAYSGTKNHATKYSDDDVRLCVALFAEGLSRKVIAEKMEISYQRVCEYIRGSERLK